MNKKIFFSSLFLVSSLFSHTSYLYKKVFSLTITNTIPKIIHQIWVGNKPIPEKYKQYMETWIAFHPDWEYRLWTDEDVDDFPWRNKDLFLQAENPGMKSDIWRYEIVNHYGGLYVDADMQACRSFEPIHSRLEFYAGYMFGNFVSCGIFASKPDSPILNNAIESLRESIGRYNFDVFDADVIMEATGPLFFTKIIEESLPSTDVRFNVILPHQYFQPVECQNRGIPKTKIEFFNIQKICFAIDHNGSSWVP